MQMWSALRTSTFAISLFAVVCAAVIATTQVTTVDRIAQNERTQKAKALYDIIPRSLIDNDLLEDTIQIVAPRLQGHSNPVSVYRARKDGRVTAVILPLVAPDGYSGAITLIAGVYADGSVAGVRVLTHKETPGLGDKVDIKKSNWIYNFNGLSKQGEKDSRWAVQKDGGDFDQFTGATITPRAVVGAVSRALDYFAQHRTELLDLTADESVEVTN
ncbi:electron transport complex subunit RsxG [Neptuniibacter pectenicola]|uniref:electron transport complex subunit RsxG n=1 Tax=Neptuniibacter pectenicola TaxID=1806669 RepID=UPI0008345A77|nr:electron transport complex subunit RsxG [Neptuniibacter pectenicola]